MRIFLPLKLKNKARHLKGWFDTTGCFALKKVAHEVNKGMGGLGASPQAQARRRRKFWAFGALLLGYVLGLGSLLTHNLFCLFIYKEDKLAYKYLIKVNATARGPCVDMLLTICGVR